MDPADFALTSVEEQAREKVERKQADEMDEAHIEASFRVLHGRASASARFADQVRACLHGHPQLLGPVFDLVRIAERE